MKKFKLAVHGGAGVMTNLSEDDKLKYKAVIKQALEKGYEILNSGGTAISAVKEAVKIFEDCPLFNAGRGSVFTTDGNIEMEASIMCGRDLSAGATALIDTIKNPIELAECIRVNTRHVMLAGIGAENFAKQHGIEIVSKDYFKTEHRYNQLLKAKNKDVVTLDHSSLDEKSNISGGGKFGTVGAVAIDIHGDLAAATSTGGMTNKLTGRIGDTSNIGAGNYANNKNVCMSGTGTGDEFVRANAGYACAHYYMSGKTLEESVNLALSDISNIGGSGGIIAIDKDGNVTMQMNTQGMYRGSVDEKGNFFTAIYKDEN